MFYNILFSLTLIAIQTCISLLKIGQPAPHHEARQKRREMRQKQQAEQEQLELRMKELQTANENKQKELEAMRKVCKPLSFETLLSKRNTHTLLSHTHIQDTSLNTMYIFPETGKQHTKPNLI